MKPPVVFVAYDRTDAHWVSLLCTQLRAALPEAEVVLDTDLVDPGGTWANQLDAALTRATHMILVVTPESMASAAVCEELLRVESLRAEKKGPRELYPVLLRAAPLPLILKPRMWFDPNCTVEHERRAKWQGLLCSIAESASRDVLPPPPLEPTGRSSLDRKAIIELVSALIQNERDFVALAYKVLGDMDSMSRILSTHQGTEQRVNALLVLATGADDHHVAANQFLRAAQNCFSDRLQPNKRHAVELQRLLQDTSRSLPSGEGLIERYLAFVRASHEELVPFFRSKAPSPQLDTVYVEIQVEHSEARPSDMVGYDSPMPLMELVRRRPHQHSTRAGRWILVGDAGAGKTTLLRRMAWELSDSESDEGRVPVFASLTSLLERQESPLERAELALSSSSPADGLAARLKALGEQGKLVFLLDGLDEVPQRLRDRAHDLLIGLCREERWRRCPCIVTSRPIGLEPPNSDFLEAHVVPLENDQKHEILARWLPLPDGEPDYDRARALLPELQASRVVWELMSVPLYATLVAILAARGEKPVNSRAGLYRQILSILLRGDHRSSNRVADVFPCQKATRQLLSELALQFTYDNLVGEDLDDLESRLLRMEFQEARQAIESQSPWRGRLRAYLQDLWQSTAVLGAHDGVDENWRFWHKSFQEMLTAERLLEISADEIALEGILRQGKQNPAAWAEPIALMAGLHPSPDSFLLKLDKTSHSLALHAVATAEELQPETILELVNWGDSSTQRAKVIRAIPNLVPDHERAIRLLGQMAPLTQSIADLVAIDGTLLTIADPDVQELASEIRGNLYGDLPPPHPGHFLTFEAQGRQHPTWIRIEPGEYLMGAPPSDGYPHEPPQRLARIEEPFWIMATPVTNATYRLFDPQHCPAPIAEVDPSQLEDYPASNITALEASGFCRWLGGRLPSEVQWEYACRAGTDTRWWFGERAHMRACAWYAGNARLAPQPVARLRPNPWGLHDTLGNVWEWCLSEEGESPGEFQRRGGSHRDASEALRVSFRPSGSSSSLTGTAFAQQDTRDRSWPSGFRVVLNEVAARRLGLDTRSS